MPERKESNPYLPSNLQQLVNDLAKNASASMLKPGAYAAVTAAAQVQNKALTDNDRFLEQTRSLTRSMQQQMIEVKSLPPNPLIALTHKQIDLLTHANTTLTQMVETQATELTESRAETAESRRETRTALRLAAGGLVIGAAGIIATVLIALLK